jgi:hypothetical protein
MARTKHALAVVPRGVYTGTDEPLTVRDPIYPRKSEVRIRSIWTFHGHRRDIVTTWIVEAIYTYSYSESGVLTENYAAHVKYVDDVVVLRSEATREVIERRFSWLSISAAWRLKPRESEK